MKKIYSFIQSKFLKIKDSWIFWLIGVILPFVLPALLKHIKINIFGFLKLLTYRIPVWSIILSSIFVLIIFNIYKLILNKRRLQILKATYGSNENCVDITENLKRSIIDNKLKIVLSNNMAGDPAPGIVKKGIVKYKLGNKIIERTYIENDVIDLPL